MWICAHACCIFAPRLRSDTLCRLRRIPPHEVTREPAAVAARECSRVMHGPAPRAGASSTVRPAYPTRNLSCWAWWRLGKSSLPQVRAARFVRVRTAAVLHAAGRHRHTPSPRPHFSPGIIMTIAFGGLLGSTFPVLNQTAFYLVVVRAAAAVAHDGGCVVVCVWGGGEERGCLNPRGAHGEQAVLCDTFFIRALLVPALMSLLGRWNWWPRTFHVGAPLISPAGVAPGHDAAAGVHVQMMRQGVSPMTRPRMSCT